MIYQTMTRFDPIIIRCKGMEAQGLVYADVNWVKAGGVVGD